MSKRLQVCWISAGVSSFVAGWLERENTDQYIYIDIADQHKDSLRFVHDCEKELGKEVQILRSDTYANVEEACMAAGIIRSVKGFAPCTAYLKKREQTKQQVSLPLQETILKLRLDQKSGMYLLGGKE